MELKFCKCKIDKDVYWTVCQFSTVLCKCNKLCSTCQGILLQYQREGLPTSNYCHCNISYIDTLKTKISHDSGLDLKSDDQTSVTNLLNDKLDKNCIEPQDLGQTLDISPLDKH